MARQRKGKANRDAGKRHRRVWEERGQHGSGVSADFRFFTSRPGWSAPLPEAGSRTLRLGRTHALRKSVWRHWTGTDSRKPQQSLALESDRRGSVGELPTAGLGEEGREMPAVEAGT